MLSNRKKTEKKSFNFLQSNLPLDVHNTGFKKIILHNMSSSWLNNLFNIRVKKYLIRTSLP